MSRLVFCRRSTYSGFAPTLFAAPAMLGTGDGLTEANAMTLPNALAAMVGGTILGLLPGIYTGVSTASDTPVFEITDSGTSGAPTVVCCKYPAAFLASAASDSNRTELRYTGGSLLGPAALNCPILGSGINRSWIYYYGFYLNIAEAPIRVSSGLINIEGDDHRVYDCVFDGADLTGGTNDNWNFLFVQSADRFRVRNNKLRNMTWGGNQNLSAITFYGALDFVIEHNEFDDVYTAIFVKGDSDAATHENSGIIRYNKFDGVARHCVSVDIVASGAYVDIYQNLGLNAASFVNLDDSSDHGPEGTRCYNNTVINLDPSPMGDAAGLRTDTQIHTGLNWYNNIVYSSASAASVFGVLWDAVPTLSLMDYNRYYEDGGTVQFRSAGVTYSTIETWRTYLGLTHEDSSSIADPVFQDAPGGDYRLAVGSSSKTAGNTGGPIGCYISGNEVMGVEP